MHAQPIYPITRYFPLSAPKPAAPELSFCFFGQKPESGHPPASTDTHHTDIVGWRPTNTKTAPSCNSYAQLPKYCGRRTPQVLSTSCLHFSGGMAAAVAKEISFIGRLGALCSTVAHHD